METAPRMEGGESVFNFDGRKRWENVESLPEGNIAAVT